MAKLYFLTDNELVVNVSLYDVALRTMLLRLKRMLLRSPMGVHVIEQLVTNWDEGETIHIVSIPMPDDWQVRFNCVAKGRMSLVINSPSVSLTLVLIPNQNSETDNKLVGKLLYVGLKGVDAIPFSESEVVGELMEFIYDYSDYKEMVDE